jgi:hypothetical protein
VFEERSYHVHDGFYLRMAAGIGPQWTRFYDSFLGDSNRWGGSFDLQLGGTPARGLVVGGGLWFAAHDASHALEVLGDTSAASFRALLVGPFIDFFPNPKQGFHFGGTIGLGGIGITSSLLDSQDRTSGGLGLGGWLGQDWWVGPEWSLGFQVRLFTVGGHNANAPYDARSTSMSFMFTVLYH